MCRLEQGISLRADGGPSTLSEDTLFSLEWRSDYIKKNLNAMYSAIRNICGFQIFTGMNIDNFSARNHMNMRMSLGGTIASDGREDAPDFRASGTREVAPSGREKSVGARPLLALDVKTVPAFVQRR